MSTFYKRRGKRALDVVGATAALVATAPVMGLAAIAVRRELGAPVLFRQTRPGREGCPFVLLKFRTMRVAVDSSGFPLSDEERISALGQLLRSWSVDELPELWNVLRGDMSLVGPRPLLVDYLDRYSPEEARRHEVRPGITGWAQVNGRNAISWEQKFCMDVWYVDHVSLRLDLKILWRTVRAVLAADGISATGHATMPMFTPVA